MAGIDRYSDQSLDEEDNYDELDNSQRLLGTSRNYNNYPIENFSYNYSPRDLTLNLQKTPTSSFKSYHPVFESPESDEVSLKHYLSVSVSVISLITENVISHPFIVIRRQAQVYHNSKRYHIVPIRIFPVIGRLYKRQGITPLWKGLGSSLLTRGMLVAVEDVSYIIHISNKSMLFHNQFCRFFRNSRLGQRKLTQEQL
jgi:solute carrier family 25 protein 46